MTIKDLEPKVVWNNFYQITRIPRPSKHEEKIRQYLLDWGKSKGFEAFADKTGNVIIRVPATPGLEDRKGVILQGHMDMVPQKNSDKIFDFEKNVRFSAGSICYLQLETVVESCLPFLHLPAVLSSCEASR